MNTKNRKGLSSSNHDLSIENFVEVINFHYPNAWFNYIHECSQRLKANMQTMTMQIIAKKLLLGVQFPMLDLPKKPEFLKNLPANEDINQLIQQLSPEQQAEYATYSEKAKNIRSLPKTRI